jgi:hypothetical protein
MHFADWVSLAPAAIAVYAVFSAWRAQPAWLMLRRRHAAMKSLGIVRADSKRRVKEIIHGRANSPADELNWLATGYPAKGAGGTHGPENPMPFTFAATATELEHLAAAYGSYAADLQRGSFLGTTAVPVVEREAEMALKTSTLLAEAAAGGGFNGGRDSSHLRVATPAVGRTLEWWQLPDARTGTLAYDTFVSYRRHRLRPEYAGPAASAPLEMPGLETENMDASGTERAFLRRKLEGQHSFDGVLPRLVDWRTERDNGNGRLRLHLALAETTYAAVLLDHYPRSPDEVADSRREVAGSQARLLTLSAMIVTTDRMMIFAGRSKHAGSHPEKFGPAVNGNLELRPRKGILSDSDEFGLPDPRRALARESAEELGLALDPERIQMLGLGRFSLRGKEVGTHVFLALAQPGVTADQVAAGIRDADPMEGRWELGGKFLAAPLPRDEEGVEPAISWLLHDTSLTPHATLAGIATIARYFPVDDEMLQRLAAAPQDGLYAPRELELTY